MIHARGAETVPRTGDQYEIAAGPYRAIITETGAGLRSLTCEGRPLVLSYDPEEPAPAASGQLLVPWPNRIDHGRYSYGGQTYQLDISEPGRDTAIHGLARWDAWRMSLHEANSVRFTHRLLARPGYPFCLELAVEYSLNASDGLRVRLTAENPGARAAPYGHGAHPYLTVGRPLEECLLSVPAEAYVPIDDRQLPAGAPEPVAGTPFDFTEPRPIGTTAVNNAYTRLRRDTAGRAWVRLSARDGADAVSLWMDEAHPWVEIYTADEAPGKRRRAGLGAEPMTCPPNAFATGTDVIELQPGERATGTWGIMSG